MHIQHLGQIGQGCDASAAQATACKLACCGVTQVAASQAGEGHCPVHSCQGRSACCMCERTHPLGVQRMGQGPRQEGSEEVRLQLAHLLICLLRPPDASQHTIKQQLPDLVAATCSAVADASPDIKRVRLPMCHMLCHSARLCAGSLRLWAQVASVPVQPIQWGRWECRGVLQGLQLPLWLLWASTFKA